MATKYEVLQKRVLQRPVEQPAPPARELQATGELSKALSAEEKIDWAYGNTVIENAEITLDMVKTACSTKHPNE